MGADDSKKTSDLDGVSLFLLRGSATTDSYFDETENLSFLDALRVTETDSRAELLTALAVTSPKDKPIAMIEIGRRDPTGRNLRVVESIRRSPRLSGLCRPVAIGQTEADRRAADNAGAYAFVPMSNGLDASDVEDLLVRVSTRVPRDFAHSRGPFIDLSAAEQESADDGVAFDRTFRTHFDAKPGPLDLRIIRAWAMETPDKTLVDAIGEDPDSGWSSSAVRRRIERLRDRAPVLFRDAAGNLAKARLARQFPLIPPDGDGDELATWPDIDRCVALSSDDELMKRTFLDDGARLAFDVLASQRIVESQRRGGRPPSGSRLRQLMADLASSYERNTDSRFVDVDAFRTAIRRALFAIADTQLEDRHVAQVWEESPIGRSDDL